MTDEEKFLFDLKGYILFPAVLGEDEMAPIKEQCEILRSDRESLPPADRIAAGRGGVGATPCFSVTTTSTCAITNQISAGDARCPVARTPALLRRRLQPAVRSSLRRR